MRVVNELEPVDFRTSLVSGDLNLVEAAQRMQLAEHKLLLVVNDENALIGIVSDGDLRRCLSNNLSQHSNISIAMTRNPLVFIEGSQSVPSIVDLMKKRRLLYVPKLDPQKRLVGLFKSAQIGREVQVCQNPVVIMAGGRGLRLRPLTDNMPKPMLKVGDKPVLHHLIEHLARNGFKDFRISLGYLGSIIEDYFEDGTSLGVSIKYIEESRPLGTAGALGGLTDITLPFLVMNGDVVIEDNLSEMIAELNYGSGPDILIGVKGYSHVIPYGCVEFSTASGQLIRFEEKPEIQRQINAGIYCLKPEMLRLLKEGEACDMPDLIDRAVRSGSQVKGHFLKNLWVDMGSKSDLEWLDRYFSDGVSQC